MSSEATRILRMSLPETLSPRRSTNGKSTEKGLEHALECYGAERLMVGSDWPVCTLASSYRRTMAIVEEALGGCSSKERASVLGGTAQRLWNL